MRKPLELVLQVVYPEGCDAARRARAHEPNATACTIGSFVNAALPQVIDSHELATRLNSAGGLVLRIRPARGRRAGTKTRVVVEPDTP